jgi:hypothetical protein
MRLTCLLTVGLIGIAAAACKDPQPAKPSEAKPTATPGSATSTPTQAQPRASAPTLDADKLFDAETRDATWASSAEQSIEAVAPRLQDVTCRHMQCRATVTSASEAELMAVVDKLQDDDSLRGIDGVQSIKLTQPEQRDGKIVMRLYVRFNRD